MTDTTQPTRTPRRLCILRVGLMAMLALAAACATIGDETAFPGPVSSGIGPFRPLTMAETGLDATGRVVPAGGAFDRGMRTAGALWYAHGAERTDPPERNAALAAHQVDWNRFAPRRILRSASNAPTSYSVEAGAEIFAPDAAWQGDAVFDPWAVEESDGQVRLYFAGDGGIGMTRGPSSGPFGPSTLILENARAPSVIEYEGEQWMFFERNGAIGLATSMDGTEFTVQSESLDLGMLTPKEEVPNETTRHSPGAVVVTSPIGRTSVRVYFGVTRDDGTTSLGVSATQDGTSFDRWDSDVFSEATVNANNPAQPAPYVEEDGITFLYASRGFARGEALRLILGGISPARTMLVPTEGDSDE